jgi:hypothetical protein
MGSNHFSIVIQWIAPWVECAEKAACNRGISNEPGPFLSRSFPCKDKYGRQTAWQNATVIRKTNAKI